MAAVAVLLSSLLAPAVPASAEQVTRRVGQLRIVATTDEAHPGGIVIVRLNRLLGTTLAVLGGRRIPFLSARGGPRAVVPVPVDMEPGATTLGIELRTRHGRQRIAVPVTLSPRVYASDTVEIPEDRRALLEPPDAVRDGRHILQFLRTVSNRQLWSGPFQPPVPSLPRDSFGVQRGWSGADGLRVDALMDSVYGDYHRGLDYPLPVGSEVAAPAGGTVLFAGPRALTGTTLLIDHGQGIVSLLANLLRTEVQAGQTVTGGQRIAVSGESGLPPGPQLHWAVYVHTIAVDPRAVLRSLK